MTSVRAELLRLTSFRFVPVRRRGVLRSVGAVIFSLRSVFLSYRRLPPRLRRRNPPALATLDLVAAAGVMVIRSRARGGTGDTVRDYHGKFVVLLGIRRSRPNVDLTSVARAFRVVAYEGYTWDGGIHQVFD